MVCFGVDRTNSPVEIVDAWMRFVNRSNSYWIESVDITAVVGHDIVKCPFVIWNTKWIDDAQIGLGMSRSLIKANGFLSFDAWTLLSALNFAAKFKVESARTLIMGSTAEVVDRRIQSHKIICGQQQ